MKPYLRLSLILFLVTVACASTSMPATQSPPTVAPITQASPLPLGEGQGEGYISFIINIHDWIHPTESADTILRLVDLFEKYNVRGDFYFTAEITRQYMQERPDVIERLKNRIRL
ncbi:MAG: hypothetical protein M1485_01185, partial [Chloroflexi bacterium]|nr:hypothetical protein [Chloroflexota bacterium]